MMMPEGFRGDRLASQTEPAMANARYAWYVVVILAMAFALSYVDRQILSLLVEPIKRDLGLSDTQISLVHGFTFAIFYAVMGLPLGRLADSHNRRVLITLSVGGWSVMTALCGLSRNFWHLFLARVGVGIGEAGLSPAAFSLIGDYFPLGKQTRAIAVYTLGPFMGGGLAYLVGGAITRFTGDVTPYDLPLIGTVMPWQLAFLLVSLPGVVVVTLLLTIKEPIRRDPYRSPERLSRIRDAFSFIRSRTRLYVSQGVGFALLSMLTLGQFAWIPSFFVRTYHWPVSQAAFAFGLIVMTCGTVGTITGGILADRWLVRGVSDAYQRIGMAVTVGMAVPAAVAPLMPSPQAALICLAASIFFQGWPVGLGPAALTAVSPGRIRGQVVAIYYFTVSVLGLGLGPLLVALITDKVFHDPQALRYSLALIPALVAPLAILCIASGRAVYRHAIEDVQSRLA